MSAIVKANASLAAGELAILKRNFAASDTGQMTYAVDYCCLSQFASKWTPFFKSGSQPPTALPANMLLLQLTKTPTLVDLQTETMHGLTYFKATYSAGVETDVTITEESDIRTHTWSTSAPVGYRVSVPYTIDGSTTFVQTGTAIGTNSFEYVSITARAVSKNKDLPEVKGRVIMIPNSRYTDTTLSLFDQTTIDTFSSSKNSRGEYSYTKTSTGIIK